MGDVIVRVDPKYYRPAEVEALLGDPGKAKARLGWEPKITVHQMIDEMIDHDLNEARKQRLLKEHGFSVALAQE